MQPPVCSVQSSKREVTSGNTPVSFLHRRYASGSSLALMGSAPGEKQAERRLSSAVAHLHPGTLLEPECHCCVFALLLMGSPRSQTPGLALVSARPFPATCVPHVTPGGQQPSFLPSPRCRGGDQITKPSPGPPLRVVAASHSLRAAVPGANRRVAGSPSQPQPVFTTTGPACQGRPPEGRLRRVSARAESPLQEFPFERGRMVAEEASGRRPRHRADVGGQGPSRWHAGRGTVSRGRRHRVPEAAPHFPTAARGLLAGPRVASDLEGPERMTARGCTAASQRPSFQRAPSRRGISNPPPHHRCVRGGPGDATLPGGAGKQQVVT